MQTIILANSEEISAVLSDPSRFHETIGRFDLLNAEDPNQETAAGTTLPKELLYAQRMTDRLMSYEPGASEALQLAARCQHIQRWMIPRSEFPMDRMGYKMWRSKLMSFHAETASSVLLDAGYGQDMIFRVQALVRKKGLKQDPEAQTLEDVICLVFLEHYAADFAQKHEQEKVIRILKKTWLKMSPKGHEAALVLPLPGDLEALIAQVAGNT